MSKNKVRAKTPNKPRSCTLPSGKAKRGSNLRHHNEKVEARGWRWPPPESHFAPVDGKVGSRKKG